MSLGQMQAQAVATAARLIGPQLDPTQKEVVSITGCPRLTTCALVGALIRQSVYYTEE